MRVYKAKEILFHKRLRIVRNSTTPSIDAKGALSTAKGLVCWCTFNPLKPQTFSQFQHTKTNGHGSVTLGNCLQLKIRSL